MEINITILEYIGRLGPGVVAQLSILHSEKIYSGMVFYTEEHLVIEIERTLTSVIGNIEEHKEYDDIVIYLKDNLEDYTKIAPMLVDLSE